MIFRFDDISINTDMLLTNSIKDVIRERFPDCQIIYAVSPLVYNDEKEKQRIFPKEWNAQSDHRIFYKMDNCGIPELPEDVDIAAHGIAHIDHRLLSKEVQELSILTSCSLAKCNIFVPPFNKWNAHTDAICNEHEIELIKWEDGWLCAEYNPFYNSNGLNHKRWYLHTYSFTLETFRKWIQNK